MKKVVKEIIYISIITLMFFKIAYAWESLLDNVSHGGFSHGFSYFFDLEPLSHQRLKVKATACLFLLLMFIVNFIIFRLLKFGFEKSNLSNRIILAFLFIVLLFFMCFSFYFMLERVYYRSMLKEIITISIFLLLVYIVNFVILRILKIDFNELKFANEIVLISSFLVLLFFIYTSPYMILAMIMITF